MNIKSTWRAFDVYYQIDIAILGVWSFLPFTIKRILSIKRIFPCSFGNKRMRLLTRVYGIITSTINHLHACG